MLLLLTLFTWLKQQEKRTKTNLHKQLELSKLVAKQLIQSLLTLNQMPKSNKHNCHKLVTKTVKQLLH